MKTVWYDRSDQRLFQWVLGTAILAHTDEGKRETHTAQLLSAFPFPDQLDSILELFNHKGLVALHHRDAGDTVPSKYGTVAANPGLRDYVIELQDKLEQSKQDAELLELNRQQVRSNRIIALTGALVALASVLSILKELGFLGLITDVFLIKVVVTVVLLAAFGYLIKVVVDVMGGQ
jgi:hypothetical protein